MSQPDAAAARTGWMPQRLTVPRTDRSLLVQPALDVALRAAVTNRAHLESAGVDIQGRSLTTLRRWAREACLAEAQQHTQSLVRADIPLPDTRRQPVFLSGHQPSLYHPGVWVKNFAIDRLAKSSGGLSLNLIVDNDTLSSTTLRVPTGTREQPSLSRVPFDQPRAVQPWEDAHIVDHGLFSSFDERVESEMSRWGLRPLLADIWDDAVAQSAESTRLADCLSAARHCQERRWGLTNLELPISRLCQSEPFLWFAAHLLAHHARFRECHNRVLGDYRQLNRVRSRNHPVPALREQAGWQECPFWVWSAGDTQRRGVFARQWDREVHLSDGQRTIARLPLTRDTEACCAVEALRELSVQGLRFRTRALTTTLFARLCLGDLFVHGIGGAKYDEMTDQIIRTFFNITPPRFLTMSATLYLPMAEPFAVDEGDLRGIRRLLRDLEFNAERHGLGPTAAALIQQKQGLLAEKAASRASGLSRRQRMALRPQNRRRHLQLAEVERELAALAGSQRQAALDELTRVTRQLSANRVLRDREYSFGLYPAESLRPFLTNLPLDVARGA